VANAIGHQHDLAARAAPEIHRLARRAEARFDFGADRHPVHLRPQDVDEPRVALVAAVVADAFPEPARRDANARPIRHAIILRMAHRKPSSIGRRFEAFSSVVTRWTGSTQAFAAALLTVIGWAAVGPIFHYSDTWQLAINTGTTIVTFLMVFLIQ